MEIKSMDFLVNSWVLLVTIHLCGAVEPSNISQGKPTRQLGTYASQGSELAVDGDTSLTPSSQCAHPFSDDSRLENTSEFRQPAWWSVDLSGSVQNALFTVSYVTIYQRDDCCYERTAPLYVGVGKTSSVKDHVVCGELKVEEMFKANVTCNVTTPIRYLSIRHKSEISMGLCEVEVFGISAGTTLCEAGYYGSDCDKRCYCRNNAPCMTDTGECAAGCEEKHYGNSCEKVIPRFQSTSPNVSNVTHDSITVTFEPSEPRGDYYRIVVNSDGPKYTGGQGYTFVDLTPNTKYTITIYPAVHYNDSQIEGHPLQVNVTTHEMPTTTTTSTTATPTTTTTMMPTTSTSIRPSPSPKSMPPSMTTTTTQSAMSSTTAMRFNVTSNGRVPAPTQTEQPNISGPATTESSPAPETSTVRKVYAPKGIDGGMIAGVVIAVLIFIVLLGVIAFAIIKRRKKSGDSESRGKLLAPLSTLLGRLKGGKEGLDNHGLVTIETEPVVEEPSPTSGSSAMSERNSSETKQMKRPGIKLSEIPIYIQSKKEKPNGFKDEYKILPNGPTAAWTVGNKAENKTKNRFLNIRAYDDSRVVLSTLEDDIHSDYINADYITGYGGKEKTYIAAQGPKKSTIIDMWRMIWETEANRIVMVTNLVEGGKMKCERYWPEKDTETYGDIEVTILSQVTYSAYVIRTMNITREGTSRTVHQFHFTGWSDHGVPTVVTDLLEFRRRIRTYDNGSTGPLLIHCSAGVGRTGTFIAIDYCLDQAEVEKEINVWDITNKMRLERVNMIQTLDQYVFVYDALYEAILTGDTMIDAARFSEAYDRLYSEDVQTKKSLIGTQFEVLETLKNTKQDEKPVALQDDNIKKNRFKDLVPNNRFRPFLSTQIEGCTSYINAVYVDSFLKKHAFIITQAPLSSTVVDFWRLIHDHQSNCIVMLNDADEQDKDSPVYWPENKEESIEFGPIEISLAEENTEKEGITSRTFVIQNNQTKRPPATVKQFQLTKWPNAKTVDSHVLLDLLNLIEKWQKENGNNSALTLHDMNGTTRCGQFIALIYVLEQLKIDQQVDVFRCVRQIRVPRHQFIIDLDQYKFVHDMINRYIEQFSDYSNFS